VVDTLCLLKEGIKILHMNLIIDLINKKFAENKLSFKLKPILFGGLAMEYYGLRKAGKDTDFIISDEDYQLYAEKYPNNRFDIWGDMGIFIWGNKGDNGVFIEPYIELYRSNVLLDYNFYLDGALEEECLYIVSLEKLLITRVFAIETQKYKEDLILIENYIKNKYKNKRYSEEAEMHEKSYKNNEWGIVINGKYSD